MLNAAQSAAGRAGFDHPAGGYAPGFAATIAERGPGLAGFVLPFALVVYLGLKGGGYDLVIYSEVGIAIWWLVVLGALIGVLPGARISRVGWIGLGLLVAFAIWTGLGIGWSESAERSVAELGRIAAYLGVFVLALATAGQNALRRTVGAVASATALLGVLALLSRLHPGWFPTNETAASLPETRARLNYPLNYWNGLAALIAMSIPLVVVAGVRARWLAARALSVAVLPALVLAAYYTLSRGGAIEIAVGVVVLLALHPRRLAILPPMLLGGAGGAILVAAASQRDALQDGLVNATAAGQGDEMLALALVVCAGVGLLGAAIALAARHGIGPRPRIEPRRVALTAAIAAGLFIVVAIAAGVPAELSDRWQEFKQPNDPGGGVARLESSAGNGRYQAWQAAVDANATDPLVGIGPGTFEYWWAREGTVSLFLRDAHSLYLETLAEDGIVGLALLLAFLVTIVIAGLRLVRSASEDRRVLTAAAMAAIAAFLVAAAYDWIWELPVLAIAFLLLAGAVLGTRRAGASATSPGSRGAGAPARERDASAIGRGALAVRVLLGAAAAVSVVAIAIPMTGADLLRDSQDEASAGDLGPALDDARAAHDVQPFAASPLLQEALVLELSGDLGPAASAARSATDKESTNWQNWLVLSRLEAKLDHPRASVRAYHQARALNPRSAIFQ
jgi:O-antigen ligase